MQDFYGFLPSTVLLMVYLPPQLITKWFINPTKYSYQYHKPQLLELSRGPHIVPLILFASLCDFRTHGRRLCRGTSTLDFAWLWPWALSWHPRILRGSFSTFVTTNTCKWEIIKIYIYIYIYYIYICCMVLYSTKANNLGMKTYKNHDKSYTIWLIPERISWVKSSQRWASHFQLWKE